MIFTALTSDLEDKFKHLWKLVGNTLMLELHYVYLGIASSIYVKCENYNFTGSIKDRIALYIMHQAYNEGKIKPGDTIIEVTSGNTGIAFAAIGKVLGNHVKIIMPDWLSNEWFDIIKDMGAEVVQFSKEEGVFLGSIRLAEYLNQQSSSVFFPRQFKTEYNAEAYEQTIGPEIWKQLEGIGKIPDVIVAGVGTGGIIMGVGNYLRSKNPGIKVHPLEPAESPTLTTGLQVGNHRIQGISDESVLPIVKLNELDVAIQVNDGDAIIMAQKLAKQLGLAVGISSGANVVGAIRLKAKMGHKATIVTILCDDNRKNLSTDLMKVEPVRQTYASPRTEFTGYSTIGI